MKKKYLRLLSFLVAVMLLIPSIPHSFAYNNVQQWAIPELDAMSELGILPDSLKIADMQRGILRKEMCEVAVLAYEKYMDTIIPVPQYYHPFTDTTDTNVEKAYTVGIVSGDGNGIFRPNDTLTRQEFFKIIGNFLNVISFAAEGSMYADLSVFSDASTLAPWAEQATSLAVGIGVIKGADGKLDPLSPTKMEQGLALFYRVYTTAVTYRNDYLLATYPGAGWGLNTIDQMDRLGMIPAALKGQNVNTAISRINVCKLVIQAYKVITWNDGLTARGEKYFSDTNDPDVNLAYDLHLISGDGNGKFRPNDSITRQEFFKIVVNFLHLINYNYDDDPTVELNELFSDYNQIASWAISPIRLLVSMAIIRGDGDKVNPTSNITTQESIALLYRCYTFEETWTPMSPGEENRTQPTRSRADALVAFALSYVGYPYVYGASGPNSFDCSGFVQYCFKNFDTSRPITTGRICSQQMNNSIPVSRDELLPADLLFFANNCTVAGISHVGIYIGDGKMVHASTSTTGVIISSINTTYYITHFIGAGRFIVD